MILFMEQLRFFILKNKYFLLLSGILLLIVLFVNFYGDRFNDSGNINMFSDNSYQEDQKDLFYIEVLGQVKNPGVYALKIPVLVIQAIDLAGGFTIDADMEFVHKVIPLSTMVKPEQKIYIPATVLFTGDNPNLEGLTTNIINLNTSSQSELMNISGVGEVTADKIVSIRPISNWDQVQQIPNLKSTTFQEIKKSAVL